ncbi:MAG: hypothetical protein KC731_25345 [Myxococcales bacterium]|nr:hypothetical protein [Myxococcales bacterium]
MSLARVSNPRANPVLSAGVLAVGLLASPAMAAPSSPSEPASERGLALMRAAHWSEAAAVFEAEDATRPSPITAFYLARCREEAGQLVAALAAYQRAALPVAGDAAPSLREVQARAVERLATLEPRVPVLALEVKAEPGRRVALFVDGVALKGRTRLPVDPGPHRVRAEIGEEIEEREVVARLGHTERVLLDPAPNPGPRVHTGRILWGSLLAAGSLGLAATFVYATVRADDEAGDPMAMRTLQIATLPSALVTAGLAAYLFASSVEPPAPELGFLPIVSPTRGGAELVLRF